MTGFSLVMLCDRWVQLERFLVLIISASDSMAFTILYSDEQFPDTSTCEIREERKTHPRLIVCFKTEKPPTNEPPMQTLFPQFTQSLGRKIAWRPKESLRSWPPTNLLVGTRHAKTTGKPARSRLRLLYKTIYLACPINDRTRKFNLFDGTARRSTRIHTEARTLVRFPKERRNLHVH